MKGLILILVYSTVILCLSQLSHELTYTYNNSIVIPVADVIQEEKTSAFFQCSSFNLNVLQEGNISITKISNNVTEVYTQVLVPNVYKVRRPQDGVEMFISWHNATHHSHISIGITEPVSVFELEDVKVSKEKYYERYYKGFFNLQISWKNSVPDVSRRTYCWLSGRTPASCQFNNSTSLKVTNMPSRVAINSGIHLRMQIGGCTVSLSTIYVPDTECPTGNSICTSTCPSIEAVNITAEVIANTLEVKWLPPAELGDMVAAYAIRWGLASGHSEDIRTEYKARNTVEFDWIKPNGSKLSQSDRFLLPAECIRDIIIIQVVPLCEEKMPLLQELGNSTRDVSNEHYLSLLSTLFRPERVDVWLEGTCDHLEQEPSEAMEPVDVSVTEGNVTEVPNDNQDVVSTQPIPEKRSEWMAGVFPVMIGILIITFAIIAFKQSRCRKSQSLKELKSKLQPNPLYLSLYQNCGEADKWEIDYDSIEWGEEIGYGAFGSVYKCVLRDGTGAEDFQPKPIAVKTLTGDCGVLAKHQFIQEILVMKELERHSNIIHLIACVTLSEPACLITEYAVNGDLLSYLRSLRAEDLDGEVQVNRLANHQLFQFAIDIATGMEYISSKGYVHRDLAARNLLLDEHYAVKIADFGLSRYLHSDDVYVVQNSKRLPVKWLSLEALTDLTFSTASDVWAYGVVLYELVTLGATPYSTIDPADMLKYLIDGNRMSRPANCELPMYNLMLECWQMKPTNRPTFHYLHDTLVHVYTEYKSTESSETIPNEVFDIDEGCDVGCPTPHRSPLISESSNYSDVSMIISSPQLQRNCPNRAESNSITSSQSLLSDRSAADEDSQMVYYCTRL